MSSFKFPILLSENFNGFVTAQCVGEDVAGFGETKDAAVAQVKEYLQWFYADAWWREPEEFGEATLLEIRVDMRPEYKVESRRDEDAPKSWQEKKKRREKQKKRVFAAAETLPLRVACIYRQEENGSYFATLPLLNIEFYFYELPTLKQLVTAYVQEKLRGATPLDLTKYLPPRRVWLEEVSFQIKRRQRNYEFTKEVPTLAQVAEPLGAKEFTKRAKAYERDAEIADLIKRLTTERANLILLGESGVGKTTVLTEAVRRVEEDLASGKTSEGDDYDEDKKPRHRFWQTNGGRLIAGMKYLGQWQERCEEVIKELSDIEGVLCIESLLDLIRVGGSEAIQSLAAFFMPYLQRGELRMVIEATPAEIDACRRLLPGFTDLFQIVRLPEFSREEALSLLEKIAAIYTRNNQIVLEQNTAGLIYRLFRRFMPYQTFPGKVPAFLRELFEKKTVPLSSGRLFRGHPALDVSAGRTHNSRQDASDTITREQVIEHFIKLTGLPELFLRDEVTLEIEDVVSELETQVIGQPNACRAVANIVTTFKAGLNDPQRPLGVLLFVGQTGVGKTELAKALSRFFFGAGDKVGERLIRLDMSEYSLPGSASRLLTSSDGQPSELIQQVRQQPFCVVLFDEIEKADAQVFDVLLGLFDEGRLTDRFGRVTNFRSAVVILTSNLGAEKFGSIGFGENAAPSFEREAQAFFRPEFFNRLDAVVQFATFNQESLLKITQKELQSLNKREGLQKSGVRLVWTPAVVEHLAKAGFDARYGARPLQRTIETLIAAPLAKFLLAHGDLQNQPIAVDLDERGQIVFALSANRS
jgi:ATP-dependent Clp protease ATP-binding subunit ClpC